uniref:C2 family cysteine protease n=1 Tax=Pseudomonas sp. 71_D TaxID=2813564 RepID=UPI001A9CE5E4
VIDDKLPTFDNKLIFSLSLNGPIFWVPLLEKAYAKLYGSYENMSTLGNLNDVLTDFTGGIVETITLKENDKMDQFRMIAEELNKKSLIFATSKDEDFPSNPFNINRNSIYLINNIKKPSSGTFRKTFLKETSPGLIHLMKAVI